MPRATTPVKPQSKPRDVKPDAYACSLPKKLSFGSLRRSGKQGQRSTHMHSSRNLLARRAENGNRVADRHEFHGRVAIVFEVRKFAENVCEVDLAGSRLVTARHIGSVDKSYKIDIFVQLLDQVALGNLLMIEVIQELQVRIVNFTDDLESF